MTEHVITRKRLREIMGVHTDTVRRWIKGGKLPPYDVAMSRKSAGWKPSTLAKAGIMLAETEKT
jgi:predicted site-specific integrase-resolvase